MVSWLSHNFPLPPHNLTFERLRIVKRSLAHVVGELILHRGFAPPPTTKNGNGGRKARNLNVLSIVCHLFLKVFLRFHNPKWDLVVHFVTV